MLLLLRTLVTLALATRVRTFSFLRAAPSTTTTTRGRGALRPIAAGARGPERCTDEKSSSTAAPLALSIAVAVCAPARALADQVLATSVEPRVFEPRGVTALDSVVFVVGVIPFAWAAVTEPRPSSRKVSMGLCV